MRHTLLILSLLLTLTTATSTASASVPGAIPISGTLTDADGKKLDGDNEIGIIWFDKAGREITSERFTINGGWMYHYSTQDTVIGAAADGSLHEVELVINGEVQEPRIQIGSVPYALRSGVAQRAESANMIGAIPASQILTTAQHTWASLMDKPSFSAVAPLSVLDSTQGYEFSLLPCQQDQTLVMDGGVWACADHTSSLLRASQTLEARQLTPNVSSLELRQGVVDATHIHPLGLPATAITGYAIVSYSPTRQVLMRTVFDPAGNVQMGPGFVAGLKQPHPAAQLHVEGLLVADSFSFPVPTARSFHIAPEDFKLQGSQYEQDAWLRPNGTLYMAYGYSGLKLTAPLRLPHDAMIVDVVCGRHVTSGTLTGKTRIVEFNNVGTPTRTVLADMPWAPINPSNQLQPWTSPQLSIDTARPNAAQDTTRFTLELDWVPNSPGEQIALTGCTVHYTSRTL